MANPLAGHTNSYHTYSHDEALAGIAEAGYSAVELSAVPGWTEHVDLDGNHGELRRKLEGYGLEPVSLSAHSDLTTADGLAHGIKAVAGPPTTVSRSSTRRSVVTSRPTRTRRRSSRTSARWPMRPSRRGSRSASKSTGTSWPRALSRSRCSRRSDAIPSGSTTTPPTSTSTRRHGGRRLAEGRRRSSCTSI